MNNKAQLGNQTMIFSWLFLLIIIAGSIVSGEYLFFGATYDFRKIDATILNLKINQCLTETQIIPKTNEKLLSLCNINQKSIEDNFLIIINDETKNYNLKLGKEDSEKCILSDKNKAFPVCVNSTITINSEKYFLTTGSHQKIRRKIS